MLACGLRHADILSLLFTESALIAATGAAFGTFLGPLFAAVVLKALAAPLMGEAAASSLFVLHVLPADLVAGGLSGLVIGAVSAYIGASKLVRAQVLPLLAGVDRIVDSPTPSNRRSTAWVALLAVSCAGLAFFCVADIGQVIAVVGTGALLLLLGTVALNLMCDQVSRSGRVTSVLSMALRNVSANRRHSVLMFLVISASSFLLVCVSMNTRDVPMAGAGPFSLIAQSSVPLPGSFATTAGRYKLGFSDADEDVMRDVHVYPALISPGDDTSCLNLERPASPKLLGVDEALMSHGAFPTIPSSVDSWTMLSKHEPNGDIPAFGDADTVQWILNQGIGSRYAYRNGAANATLRFRALMPSSIFAGQLLVSDRNFRKLFPAEQIPRYFLIQTPPGTEDSVADVLRQNLGEIGLDVRTASDLLRSISRVQNTYLSAFELLGTFALLFGTFVTGVLIARGAHRRKSEMAILLAVGFRESDISRLLAAECAYPVIGGLLWGSASAAIALVPYLHKSSALANWTPAAAALAAIVLCTAITIVISSRYAARLPVIASLRTE